MAPSRRTDSNPNDLDTIEEAHVRSQIIKEHVTYPYLKAEALVDSVSSHNPADRHLRAAKASLAAVAAERVAAADRPITMAGACTDAPTNRSASPSQADRRVTHHYNQSGECWAAKMSDTLAVPRQGCRNCGKAWLCTNTPPEVHELCRSCSTQQKTHSAADLGGAPGTQARAPRVADRSRDRTHSQAWSRGPRAPGPRLSQLS